MKKNPVAFLGVMLLVIQFISAQEIPENNISSKQNKIIHLESGINLSLPVHIMMYRTHRLAIGINTRAWKNITPKFELGLKFDYDYRFIKNNSDILITPESTLEERASHSNFSIFCIKPNVQFNLNSNWYWGAETGLGYALSDEDSKIGLGFVNEYARNQQFGLCSGLYLGKHFVIGNKKKKLGLSLDFTQFLARWHAENSLGLKLNYHFIN